MGASTVHGPAQVKIVKAQPKPVAKPAPVKIENDISEVISDAKYRVKTSPKYPRRALKLKQQGTVLLHAEVAEDGSPKRLKVANSSGYKFFKHCKNQYGNTIFKYFQLFLSLLLTV